MLVGGYEVLGGVVDTLKSLDIVSKSSPISNTAVAGKLPSRGFNPSPPVLIIILKCKFPKESF